VHTARHMAFRHTGRQTLTPGSVSSSTCVRSVLVTPAACSQHSRCLVCLPTSHRLPRIDHQESIWHSLSHPVQLPARENSLHIHLAAHLLWNAELTPNPPFLSPPCQALAPELQQLQAASNMGPVEYLHHIYANHPPTNPDHMLEEVPNASNMRRVLRQATLHYHPEKQQQCGRGLWGVLCQEITKHLNTFNSVLLLSVQVSSVGRTPEMPPLD
jgi:hypothetical protein